MTVVVSYTISFFNDTATTEIYTLSLHDALPICSPPAGRELALAPAPPRGGRGTGRHTGCAREPGGRRPRPGDRKSTRLNSSHAHISYAVFCLKKKIRS